MGRFKFGIFKDTGITVRIIIDILQRYVGVFRIPLPEKFGALSLSDLLLGADAGREAAAQGMEATLMRLGMPLCRVLPFRRKLTAP